MSKKEARAQRINEWLEHLHRWKATGRSLAAYAKEHGLALWALYHWRGVLIQQGRWEPTRPPRQAKHAACSLEAIPFAVCPRGGNGSADGTVYRSIAVGQRPSRRDRVASRGAAAATDHGDGAAAMMRPSGEVSVYLCVAPVDGRKQAASLARC